MEKYPQVRIKKKCKKRCGFIIHETEYYFRWEYIVNTIYKLCGLWDIFFLSTPQRENSIPYHQWIEQHCSMSPMEGGSITYSAWDVKGQFKIYKGAIFTTAQQIFQVLFGKWLIGGHVSFFLMSDIVISFFR